jgi:hypothetical protein
MQNVDVGAPGRDKKYYWLIYFVEKGANSERVEEYQEMKLILLEIMFSSLILLTFLI